MKSFLAVLKLKLRSLFKTGETESEMAHEMRFHLENLIDQNIAKGMSPKEARQAASREFGGVEQYKEECRDSWGVRMIQELSQDIRYSVRQLNKARGFAIVAILTLAIGIGAATAIFSIVNSVALQPLPYTDSERLVEIIQTRPSYPENPRDFPPSSGAFLEIQRQTTVFEGLAAAAILRANITGIDFPVYIWGNRVTPSYFSTLDVKPILGRTFLPEEATEGKSNVMVLTYHFWQEHFAGDPSVINQTVLLNEQPHSIIGVMPEGFRTDKAKGIKAFTPYVINPQQRQGFLLYLTGRLGPDVTLQQAQAEIDVIASRLAQTDPDTWGELQLQVIPMLDFQVNEVRPMLYMLLGAVGFLLLIACVNVANLLLARASSRQREIALRTALGASRIRIVRQLLVESILLSLIGGILGSFLAYWSMSVLLSFAPATLPRLDEVALDGFALLFSCAVTMATGVAFGLIPALQASKVDLTIALKEGTRSVGDSQHSSRLRNGLVIAEISLALVLLIGAGLLARTFAQIQKTEMGYDPSDLYVERLMFRPPMYPDNPSRLDFADRALVHLASKAEFVAVAFTTGFPIFGGYGYRLDIEERPEPDMDSLSRVTLSSVTPDYFKVIKNSLLSGRWFNDRDREDTPLVTIISEQVAKQHFPQQNPLGKRIAMVRDETREWREIVGVVRDVKMAGAIEESHPVVYVPFPQHSTGYRFLSVVRVREGAPNPGLVAASAIHAVDPNMPMPRKMIGIADFEANAVSTQRFTLFLFGVFSVAALLLAAIGIYGVMAYTVSQRSNEIGVRMALGAQQKDIFQLILIRASKLIGIGILIGVAGALAGSRLLGSILYEVSPHDPVTFVGIAALLTTVAAIACYLPARRAAKVDPMIALRSD